MAGFRLGFSCESKVLWWFMGMLPVMRRQQGRTLQFLASYAISWLVGDPPWLTRCASASSAQDMDVAVALLKIAPGVSRVHASRRVFEQLQQQKVHAGAGFFQGAGTRTCRPPPSCNSWSALPALLPAHSLFCPPPAPPQVDVPVIHHITFADGTVRDDLVLQSGECCCCLALGRWLAGAGTFMHCPLVYVQ